MCMISGLASVAGCPIIHAVAAQVPNHAAHTLLPLPQLQFTAGPVSTKDLTCSFGWDTADAFQQHDVQVGRVAGALR